MNYNFERLPKNGWCVDITIEHPRTKEFRVIFDYLSKRKNMYNCQYYGCFNDVFGKYRYGGSIFRNNILTLDDFFKLIEEPIVEVDLTEGNYVVSKEDLPEFHIKKDIPYRVNTSCLGGDASLEVEYRHVLIDGAVKDFTSLLRNATKEEIESITPEWIPEQGDLVLVKSKNFKDFFKEPQVFIAKHEDLFICITRNREKVGSYEQIKPYTEPDELRPQLDELIKAYEAKGMKLIPTFENL